MSTKKNLIIYISGPITGMEENNFKAFAALEERLFALGYKTENPHAICSDLHRNMFDNAELYWQECMRMCIMHLCSADMVVTLDGWENSRGAKIEVDIARKIGIEVLSDVKFFAGIEKNGN